MQPTFHPEIARHLASRPARPLLVLDWGSGYGRGLAYLNDLGYAVEGVDISEGEVEKARWLFAEDGRPPVRMAVLDEEGRTPFEDGRFDYVYSAEVFEHVADLDATVAEMARVMAPGASGLHTFPGKWVFTEPHLLMPMVHWLPKNRLRHAAIRAYLAIGVGPDQPPEIPDADAATTARFEYDYCIAQTFYRMPSTVLRAMRRHGLCARLATAEHRKLQRFPRWVRRPAGAAVAVLRTTVIEVEKPV